MRSRAFSLLEVMVAVAILGLAFTVILSAQAGLYSSAAHVQNETVAIGLARCKMGELEEDLLRMGYPELDQLEDGPCCEDQTPEGMSCSWKVERVELPQPATFDEETAGGAGLDLAGGAESSKGILPGGSGAFGALLSAGANDAGALSMAGGADGGFGALAGMMGEATSQGVAGLAPLVMSIVYPSLKPMLEASIRKITLTVKWREGIRDRDLTVTQYVTNPMRGGLSSVAPGDSSELPGGLVPPGGGQFGPSAPAPTNTFGAPPIGTRGNK